MPIKETLKKQFKPFFRMGHKDSKEDREKILLKEFDHLWFKETYKITGTDDKLELFKIYKKLVKTHRVSPNPYFNEKMYLKLYKDIEQAVREGKFLCGFEHYLLFGKKEGRMGEFALVENSIKDLWLIEALFDEFFYIQTYNLKEELERLNISPFEHYLKIGTKKGFSPNAWFDEKWYVSFYKDVKILIEEGQYICGFEHYLKTGRKEGRIPKRKSFDILNFKFSQAIKPVGMERISWIEAQTLEISVEFESNSNLRINFVVPTFDTDIMFGGYISLRELIKKIMKLGFDIRFIICDDQYMSEDYFWYNFENIFNNSKQENVEFHNYAKDKLIKIREGDIFFSYSAFTTLLAYKFAQHTKFKKVIYLIQEDERIFMPHNSFRALIDYAYSLPIIFLFNSKGLYYYFKKYQIGPFKNADDNVRAYWFECPITEVEKPTLEELFNRKGKKLIFYARPEAHAERNLFESGIVALKRAINKGYFDNSWSFYGVGAAKKYDIDLGYGKVLKILPKMDLKEYKKTLKDYDVGLFLMYAPHPGLVGFEMAAAGLVVVVNSFDYRDEEYYKTKSENFIVAEPNPYSIAEALKEAVKKAANYEERIKNAYIPKVKTWDEALPDEMIKEILEGVGVKL